MILVKKARWAVWLLGARDVVFRCRFGPVISVLPGGSCCSVAWFRPSPSRSSGLPLEQAITVEKREVQKTKRELNVAHVHRPLHWVVYIHVRAKLYGDMNTRSAASTVTYLWQISQNMANAKISHLGASLRTRKMYKGKSKKYKEYKKCLKQRGLLVRAPDLKSEVANSSPVSVSTLLEFWLVPGTDSSKLRKLKACVTIDLK